MTSISEALTSALFHFLWQGVAVALLLSVAVWVLRHATAQSRYAAGCVALAVMAVLPVLTVWSLNEPSVESPPWFESSAPLAGGIVPQVVGLGGTASIDFFREWAIPVWAFGVLVLSMRLLWGYGHVVRLRRRATVADDATIGKAARLAYRMGRVRPFRLMISAVADGPGVVGWLRPVVLLPTGTLLGLTPQQLEAVLAHELAHIRRHDYLVNLLQSMVETLLFYHPAVWWVSSRVRRERELCCDDLAVETSGDAIGYARALTALERLRVVRPELAVGAAQGWLGFRVRRLITRESDSGHSSLLPGLIAVAFGAMVLIANPGGTEVPVLGAATPQRGTEPVGPIAGHVSTNAPCSDCHQIGEPSRERESDGVLGALQHALQEHRAIAYPVRFQAQPGESAGLRRSWLTPVTWQAGATQLEAALQFIGLTEDQRANIERLIEAQRPTLSRTGEQLETEEAALARLLESEPVDSNAVFTQLDLVIRARGDLERANTAMLLEFREYLTREQWVQFQQVVGYSAALSFRVRPDRVAAPDGFGGGGGGRGGPRGGQTPQ